MAIVTGLILLACGPWMLVYRQGNLIVGFGAGVIGYANALEWGWGFGNWLDVAPSTPPPGVYVVFCSPFGQMSRSLPLGAMAFAGPRDRVVTAEFPLLLPALVGTWATIWLWRGDRWRAGACQNCGYDQTGNTSGRCPECGANIAGGKRGATASPERGDRP